MTLSYAFLCLVQGAVVCAPVEVERRGRSRLVGLVVPVAALGVGVGVLRATHASAEALTVLAALGTPLVAACSGWVLRPRRPVVALVASALLYLVAWQVTSLAGQAAGVMLIGLACLTVAAAVARAAPRWSIELGLVLLAAVDVILVWGTDQVGTATTALAEATPPTPALPLLPDRPLPVLQQATFGSASMGWLDLLAPALLCAVVVARARRRAAITTAMAAGLWGLLLFVTPLLPATVPILAGLLVARAPSALHRMGLRTVMDSAANRVLRTGRPDRIAVRPNARP